MPRSQPSHRASRAELRARRHRRARAGVLSAAVAVTTAIATAGLVLQLPGEPAEAETAVADRSMAAVRTAVLPLVQSPDGATGSPEATTVTRDAAPPEPPPGSGEGRRIVFSESAQRVWLVGDDGAVERTYPVSGSIHDNLDPGTYEVLSRTRHATAYDYSSTMEYFVHFTDGQRAAIGFHSVPVGPDGRLEQTRDQLGTPLSAGCVRQWRDDAVALWEFAPVGTPVVVTA